MPLQEATLTSDFGPRTHPVTGEKGKAHNGVDLGAPEGAPIYSLLSGEVVKADFNNGSGNHIVVKSILDKIETRIGYAHMIEFPDFLVGAKVRQGQKIGNVGSTGMSTGNHLHLTVKQAGVAIDPLVVFPELLAYDKNSKNHV